MSAKGFSILDRDGRLRADELGRLARQVESQAPLHVPSGAFVRTSAGTAILSAPGSADAGAGDGGDGGGGTGVLRVREDSFGIFPPIADYSDVNTLIINNDQGLFISRPSDGAVELKVRAVGDLDASNGVSVVTGVVNAGEQVFHGRKTFDDNIRTFRVSSTSAAMQLQLENVLSDGSTYDQRLWFITGVGGTGFYPDSDGLMYLGGGGNRWQTVYAANGAINTSDAALKDVAGDCPYGLAAALALRPVAYRWKGGPDRSPHLGLLAQNVRDALGGHAVSGEEGRLGLAYHEIVPVLVRAVQELAARLRALEGS